MLPPMNTTTAATPTTEDPALLVDLYLRLSIAADGADSLERQEADGRKWAADNGLTVRRVWRDAGRSGYRDVKRKGFDAALSAVTSGEVRTLWVWKLDRLSRKGSGQVGTLMDELSRTGSRIVFYKDGLDTANDSHRMIIVMVSEQARAESANTSLRVSDRKAKDRAAHKYLGGLPPYGYVVTDDRKWTHNPREFALMREAVERVLAGDSLWTITNDWNARGLLTRRAHAHLEKHGRLPGADCGCRDDRPCKQTVWRPSTLSVALRSPGLAGLMPELTRPKDRKTPEVMPYRDPGTGETVSLMADGYDPIATEAEQARLLAVMDGRLRQYGRGRMPVRQPQSLLGGLLFCAACHNRAHTFGNSYRCRKWASGADECPARLSVSIDTIETAVARAWAQKLASLHDDLDSPLLRAVAARWLAKNDPGPLQERADLEADIKEAQARMDRADDDHYVRGTLDADRHARVTSGIRERLAALQLRLADLPQPVANIGALLDPALSLPALATAPAAEARDLLGLAIKRVYVTAAPKRGARFDPLTRMRIVWADEENDSDALATGR